MKGERRWVATSKVAFVSIATRTMCGCVRNVHAQPAGARPHLHRDVEEEWQACWGGHTPRLVLEKNRCHAVQPSCCMPAPIAGERRSAPLLTHMSFFFAYDCSHLYSCTVRSTKRTLCQKRIEPDAFTHTIKYGKLLGAAGYNVVRGLYITTYRLQLSDKVHIVLPTPNARWRGTRVRKPAH